MTDLLTSNRPDDATGRIVVIGSINTDQVFELDAPLRAGETLMTRDHRTDFGGKGTNQAVAAARFGAHVSLLGCVGQDAEGVAATAFLQNAGVDVTGIRTTISARTGTAIVLVDPSGENSIIVDQGANADLHLEDISLVERADVLLGQLEVDAAVVAAVVSEFSGLTIINSTPSAAMTRELMDSADVIVCNATELADLAGSKDVPVTFEAALQLVPLLARNKVVIATLGSSGSLIVENGQSWRVPARRVTTVDTTAAGDTFCGVLAAGIAQGLDIVASARFASAAGTLATLTRGSTSSIPYRASVLRFDSEVSTR